MTEYKRNGKTIKRILSLILCIAINFSCITVSFAEEKEKSITLSTISDIHYVSELNRGKYNDYYMAWAKSSNTQTLQMDGIIDSALEAVEAHAKENGMKYLLIPGDLTANGEYTNHQAIADRLLEFENETGIQVIVINGNHDINNSNAVTYAYGKPTATKATTPEQFKKIYKNLGYDLAYHTYTPTDGKAGMLSYSVKLDDGYRLIAIDAGKYSSDNTESGEDSHETAGNITEELLEWILNECEDAKKDGETVIGMCHWNMTEMNFFQGYTLQGFVIDNREYVSDTLANAGMHWVFTGHQHASDVASSYSDEGEVIYSVMSSSIVEYPNTYRETTFTTKTDGSVDFDFNVYDCDCVLPVTDSNGVTYPRPYRITSSMEIQYADFDLAQYVVDLATPFIDNNLIPGVKKAGSIVKYIENTFDISIKDLLNGLIDNGLTFGGIVIFDAGNLMNFINDIDSQLTEKYINDPSALKKLAYNLVKNLGNVKVSDEACTKFINSYGFGNASKSGTIADVAFSIFVYMYEGNEDISDDALMNDVLDKCLSGELTDIILDALVQYLVKDLVMDELLGNIEINIQTVFGIGSTSTLNGYFDIFSSAVLGLLGSDKTAKGIVNMLLKQGVVKKYGYSLDEVIEYLRGEYVSDATKKGIGYSLYNIIGGICTDENPKVKGDAGSYTYNGAVKVEATTENYRLPTIVTVTMGELSQTSADISWYTRYSVTGTDIEIYDENGDRVENIVMTKDCTKTDRTIVGADFGVFGFLNNTVQMQRHTIRLTGLEKGKKYSFRVGDEEKGWWSDYGSVTTADGSDRTDFIHISDTQCSSPYEYDQWVNLIKEASSEFDYDFILNTGDLVDHGNNLYQWQWYADKSSSYTMNTFTVPVSGNHENYGENATVTNFLIENAPEQDTTSGVYYSLDYNNVHIAVLNFNDVDENDKMSQTQLDWLINDMKKSTATWKFVAIHCSLYSNGNHSDNDDVCAIREQLNTLLPELGVDVVFSGHDHVYLRTDALTANEVTTSQTGVTIYQDEAYSTIADAKGTVYSAGGTAGTKHYLKEDKNSIENYYNVGTAYTDDTPVYTTVSAVGNKLYVKAYTVKNGESVEIDKYALVKTFTKGDVNLDSKVTVADARLVLRSVAKLTELSDLQKKAADVNGDGYVLISDARKILRAVAKLDVL